MTALASRFGKAFGKGVLLACAWGSLSYLGYWLALLIDRALVQTGVFLLLRAGTIDWQLSPFRVSVLAPGLSFPMAPLSLRTVLLGLPLLLEAMFLGWLWRRYRHAPVSGRAYIGERVGVVPVRIGLHFTGLWIVLLLTLQTVLLGYATAGQLGGLLRQFTRGMPIPPAARIGATAFVGALLLATGILCTRRLLSEFSATAAHSLPGPVRLSLGILLLGLCVQLSLLGYVGGPLGMFRGRTLLVFLVPSGFCLILALLGLIRRPVDFPSAQLGALGAVGAVGLAVALYAGLANVKDLRAWLADRELARAESTHYEILYPPGRFDGAGVRALAEERERVLAAQAARLGAPLIGLRIRVVLYPDFVSKRLATSSDLPFTVEGTTIRAALCGYVKQIDPAADAAALLHAVWSPRFGGSGSPLVRDWVAGWLAGAWRGRPPEEWAARITDEEGSLTLADLLDPAADANLSPLVRQPLGAAWVGLVFDRFGLEGVRRLYTGSLSSRNPAGAARLLDASANELERQWSQRVAELQARFPADDPPRRLPEADFFYRGVSFSHEGWTSGRGGYDSAEALEELRELRSMGVNALAAVPYGFVGDSADLGVSYTGTDESDEQLIELLYKAHGLGMKVMLKPQLWAPWAGFTGNIRFDNPEPRRRWMRGYRRFILHYARLGELEGFDLLAIGNEFEGLTSNEDDWRQLIADVRRVYHGPITYAANWGKEFETLRFWDALDYIGLNNYYPLANGPISRTEDALPGAEALARKFEGVHRRWGKPILFTEVGYPSVRGGIAQPWERAGGSGISLNEQAAGYEAIFRAFAGRTWFRGMFWWKWPSNGRSGGPTDPSFTPRGKPAAEVMRVWFDRLAKQAPPESSSRRSP